MPRDWLGGSGVSERVKAERIVAEAVRQAKLAAKNDPQFVPPNNEASLLLAARSMVADELHGGHRLTFGAHLTGGGYDGSSDVALATDAVSTNTASKIVARDSNGDFTSRAITAVLKFVLGSGAKLHYLSTGAAATAGQVDLTAGTATVNTTAITLASLVFLSRLNGSGVPGHLYWTIVPGTSFTITSSSATDTATIGWHIIERY